MFFSLDIVMKFLFLIVLAYATYAISFVRAQSYAPINVTCPSDLIRFGDKGLSPQESQYISQRRTKATQNLRTWLEMINLQDFDVTSFLANESNIPTLAIAFSGGGYRAMLNGAGVFQGNSSWIFY